MVFCRGCGATLALGARACAECGAPAPRVVLPESERPESASAPARASVVEPPARVEEGPPARAVLGHHPYDVGAAVLASIPLALLVYAIVVHTFSAFSPNAFAFVVPFLVGALAWPMAWALWRRNRIARPAALTGAVVHGVLAGWNVVGDVVILQSLGDDPFLAQYRATLLASMVGGMVQLALAVAVLALLARRQGALEATTAPPPPARIALPKATPWLVAAIPGVFLAFALALAVQARRIDLTVLGPIVVVGALVAPFVWLVVRGSRRGAWATLLAALAWGGFCVWGVVETVRTLAEFERLGLQDPFMFRAQLVAMLAEVAVAAALVLVLAQGLRRADAG